MSIPGSASPLFIGAAAGAAAAHQIDRSLRFNSADSAYLNRTPSSASNRRTWTWSGWLKRSQFGNWNFFAANGSSSHTLLGFYNSTKKLYIVPYAGVGGATFLSDAVFRDCGAFFHLCIALDTTQATSTNRLKAYVNGVELTWSSSTYPSQNEEWSRNIAGEHRIGASTQNNSYIDGYLTEIHFVDGQALAPTDFGAYDSNNNWNPIDCKDNLTYGTNGFYLKFADNSSNAALGTDSSGNNNHFSVHNFLAVAGGSTTLSISGYNNNLGSYPLSNVYDGSTSTRVLGTSGSAGTVSFSPALTGVTSLRVYQQNYTHYLNGSVVTPSASSGGWYTLHSGSAITLSSFGNAYNTDATSSIDLYAFEINGTVITSQSFTLGAASDVDSLLDTPTNYTPDSGNAGGNYATLNQLDKKSTVTLSNGNLDVTTSSTGWAGVKGTIGASSGKYYFEATANGSAANKVFFGICASNVKPDTSGYLQDDSTERAKGMLIFCDNGQYQLDGNSRVNYSSSMADGDVIAVAYDLDGNTVQFYKNGSALGSIDISGSPLASATVVPLYIHYNTNTTYHLNFGQRPFAHTPPTGYVSLCTTNLSEPVITDPSRAFDVALWTGNGSTQTISGLNLSPDFLWIKNRSSAYNHHLLDTVRGANNGQNVLYSNLTNAEGATNSVTAFTSDGFTVGSNSSVNHNSTAIVGWAWDAGTSTVSNTDGSITSNVRANAAAGFSIVKWTCNGSEDQSIGHSLGATPAFMIFKNLDRTTNWTVYHKDATTTTQKVFYLNTTGAVADYSGGSSTWWGALPTSSVFTVGDAGTAVNHTSGDEMISYCFAPVDGFSSVGFWTGNGSTDGPFVWTGFKVSWILYKRSDTSGNDWTILDSTRGPTNVIDEYLQASNSNAEASSTMFDFLSNGFKPRLTSAGHNASGGTYVYLAFASHPFKTARAR